MAKKQRRNKKASENQISNTSSNLPPILKSSQNFNFDFFKKYSGIFNLIGFLVSLSGGIIGIYQFVKEPEEKHYKADDYIRGILLPDSISDNSTVTFNLGRVYIQKPVS